LVQPVSIFTDPEDPETGQSERITHFTVILLTVLRWGKREDEKLEFETYLSG